MQASSSRFSEVEEKKITEIIDAAIPENTKRQTTWSVSIFNGELSKTEFLQLTKAAMLPSTEFIFLRVAYRKAFWEELSRLICCCCFQYL